MCGAHEDADETDHSQPPVHESGTVSGFVPIRIRLYKTL